EGIETWVTRGCSTRAGGFRDGSGLECHDERLLESLRDPSQESGGIRTADHPVVARKRQRQPLLGLERLRAPDWVESATRHPENRDLGPVHDRRERGATDPSEVRNREAASRHLLE